MTDTPKNGNVLILTEHGEKVLQDRLIHRLRKPYEILLMILFVIFVLLAGMTVIMVNLNDTVKSTDKIIKLQTSPTEHLQQQTVVQNLISGMSCADQLKVKAAFDSLVGSGVIGLAHLEPVIQSQCK